MTYLFVPVRNETTKVHKVNASDLDVLIDHSDICTQDSCGINDSIFNETLDSKFVSEENHSFSQNETCLNTVSTIRVWNIYYQPLHYSLFFLV